MRSAKKKPKESVRSDYKNGSDYSFDNSQNKFNEITAKRYRSNYGDFGMNESNIAKILLAFLKLKKTDLEKSILILEEIFESYSDKLFINISYIKISQIAHHYIDKKIDTKKVCIKVSKLKSKHKLFILYNLLDIAANDKIYSTEEEEFIDNIRKGIKIHINTFMSIKAVYTRKGMKDERQIIEEQKRKKSAESFLPYNAYKVLGVTPSVTKEQLKKIYRKLAKKYHPDKYHGQDEKVIHKAEDRFLEITKAFEIIEKHKGY